MPEGLGDGAWKEAWAFGASLQGLGGDVGWAGIYADALDQVAGSADKTTVATSYLLVLRRTLRDMGLLDEVDRRVSGLIADHIVRGQIPLPQQAEGQA